MRQFEAMCGGDGIVLRNGLRQQVLASPIFDAPRFARHFEAALRGMWRKWCDERRGNTKS